jgi:hypothetical protein
VGDVGKFIPSSERRKRREKRRQARLRKKMRKRAKSKKETDVVVLEDGRYFSNRAGFRR